MWTEASHHVELPIFPNPVNICHPRSLRVRRNCLASNENRAGAQCRLKNLSACNVLPLGVPVPFLERIEVADTMAGAPVNVSDDLYARLREHFSEEQLMELGANIAFENYRARWNRIFDVGSDELYQPQTEIKGGKAA